MGSWRQWRQLPTPPWKARSEACVLALRDGAGLLRAGWDGSSSRFNDAWRGENRGRSWAQLPSPPWQARHTACALQLRDGAISLLGGDAAGNQKLADVWRCEEDDHLQGLRDIMRYTAVSLKFIAGGVRFVFEDLLNGWCQAILLVKNWHNEDFTNFTRAFTITTLLLGILTSLFGPLKETLEIRKLRKQRDMSWARDDQKLQLKVADEDLSAVPEHVPLLRQDVEAGVVSRTEQCKEEATAISEQLPPSEQEQQPSVGPTGSSATVHQTPYRMIIVKEPIADFLRGISRHAKTDHRLLVITGLIQWFSMAMVWPIFGSPITSAGLPASCLMYSCIMTFFAMFAEMWVALHTEHGIVVLQFAFEMVLVDQASSGTLRTTESITPTGSTTAETFHMTRSAEDNLTSNLTGVEMSNRQKTEVDPADPFNVTAESPLPSLANSTASSNVLLSALTAIHAVGRIALASIVMLSTCSCLVFSKIFVRYQRERAQQKREQDKDLAAFFALLVLFFSILGRFDTFSDIVFTILLFQEDPITWSPIGGRVFDLPCELFGCQALRKLKNGDVLDQLA